MSKSKQTYEVVVESPHGKGSIEQWEHWMNKVADDAQTRWGITITINPQSESVSKDEFQ